jgi:hypothetical protein
VEAFASGTNTNGSRVNTIALKAERVVPVVKAIASGRIAIASAAPVTDFACRKSRSAIVSFMFSGDENDDGIATTNCSRDISEPHLSKTNTFMP